MHYTPVDLYGILEGRWPEINPTHFTHLVLPWLWTFRTYGGKKCDPPVDRSGADTGLSKLAKDFAWTCATAETAANTLSCFEATSNRTRQSLTRYCAELEMFMQDTEDPEAVIAHYREKVTKCWTEYIQALELLADDMEKVGQ